MENILFAFLITMIAGLSTGIGSLLALFVKKDNKKFLSISLGFSAGVMIYVSMIEMFSQAKDSLILEFGDFTGYFITILFFFVGILIIYLLDKLIPDTISCNNSSKKLYRTGIFTALVLAIHNFPEGLATFCSTLYDPTLGFGIGVAIAIHNIPEGMAVSVPIYYATGSKRKAFIFSFLSGLAEPIGALIGFIILGNILNSLTFGIIFSLISGIMVYIALIELLPRGLEYGNNNLVSKGIIIGMLVMAISLLML